MKIFSQSGLKMLSRDSVYNMALLSYPNTLSVSGLVTGVSEPFMDIDT